MNSLPDAPYVDALLANLEPLLALVLIIIVALGLTLALARRTSRRNSSPTHLAFVQDAMEKISSQQDRQEVIHNVLASVSVATGAQFAALTLDRSGENSTNLYSFVDGQLRVERVGLVLPAHLQSSPTTKGPKRSSTGRNGSNGTYQPSCLIPSHYPQMKNAVGLQFRTSYGEVGELFAANKPDLFGAEDRATIEILTKQITQHLEQKELLQQIKRGYMETIEALVNAVEAKDAYTRGHSERVKRYAVAIASEMGLPTEQVEDVRVGAVLHDIGKIGVPENVINKPGRLDDDEWRIMKEHPRMATKIIDSFNRSRDILLMIYHHHEMYDGTGYPAGLRGSEIPLAARVLKVADAFEAMTSRRPYQKTKTVEEATKELRDWSGRQFDPLVVSAFLRALRSGSHGLDALDL